MTYSSVHYEMPRSIHTHKSMLLRGVQFPPAALNRADIEATKGRASHSGRSHGGAPLRSSYGSGRGRGSIGYADTRPNPFAAHINPHSAPMDISGQSHKDYAPPTLGIWRPPQLPEHNGTRAPPGSSYQRGYGPPGQAYGYSAPTPHLGQAPVPSPFGNQNGYRQNK